MYDAMFVETNPGPVKAALAWMGKIPAEIRLPMAWPAEASIAKTVASRIDVPAGSTRSPSEGSPGP